MSEKQFEECSLGDATHVEVGGKVYKIETDGIAQIVFGSEDKTSFPTQKIGIVLRIRDGHWHTIFMDCFPILGIQPLKEVKPEPIEFEFIPSLEMAKNSWLGEHIPMEAIGKKFKCVEILEEME